VRRVPHLSRVPVQAKLERGFFGGTSDIPIVRTKIPTQGQKRALDGAPGDSDPLVHKLVMLRHSYIAHRNSHFTLHPNKFDAQYPLLFAEIDVLITRALEIGNRYSLLFDATAHATLMVGRDDYLNLL
jgi:hypothetical protein